MSGEGFTVSIHLNGKYTAVKFRIQEGVTYTVESVKNEVRSTCGVVNGTLSYSEDEIEVVASLTAGGVYHFVGFQVPAQTAPGTVPPAASFQNRDSFVRLLENAMREEVPQWKANEKIVDKIVRLYASRVLLCATPAQSLSLYQEVESLPQTTTINILNKSCDIQLNGIFFFNTKSTLINALHNGVPAIFKIGRSIEEARREYGTQQAVLRHHESTAQSLSLVNIEFVEIEQNQQFLFTEKFGEEDGRINVRFGLIMPKYALVLSQFQLLKSDHVVKWLTQIKMALVKLHEANYAHNDVKPENIFVDQNGDAYLGDFGGLAEIGIEMHEFSEVFQSSNSDHISTAENDFYSLALSALAMMNIYSPDGKRYLSKADIKMEITRHSSQLEQIFRDVLV